MAKYYDRYSKFRNNADMKPVPELLFKKLVQINTTIYKQGVTRLDKLSNMYYNNPYGGWLIMLANPEFGGLEFNIPNQTVIRIPFPSIVQLKDIL
jgi:hypothetical protein